MSRNHIVLQSEFNDKLITESGRRKYSSPGCWRKCAQKSSGRGETLGARLETPGDGEGGQPGKKKGDLVESPERVRGEVRTPGRCLERQRGLSGANGGDVELCRSLSGH